MKYETDQTSEILIDGENTLEKTKQFITDLLNLSDGETKAIRKIENLKQLENLFIDPKSYLSEENATKLLELKETYDLIGGLYFA